MIHRLQVDMQFRLISGVHVTGEQGKLWVDKALVVDWAEGNRPVLPATTLKGWLRESAERVFRGLGLPACDGSMPQTICYTCEICKIFGSSRRRSPLYFRDGQLVETLVDVRTSVSLSRYRKAAYEERLFTTEVAWPRRLRVSISGFFDSDEDAQRVAAILYLAARAGFAIGTARSRGLGWLELVDPDGFKAELNGTPISDETLMASVRSLTPQEEASR